MVNAGSRQQANGMRLVRNGTLGGSTGTRRRLPGVLVFVVALVVIVVWCCVVWCWVGNREMQRMDWSTLRVRILRIYDVI